MVVEAAVKDKETVTKEIVKTHVELDPEITEIYRFISANEESPDEPIKLLEVTGLTFETGVIDAFGFPRNRDIPYKTVFATVTPSEFQRVRRNEVALPGQWNLETALRMYP